MGMVHGNEGWTHGGLKIIRMATYMKDLMGLWVEVEDGFKANRARDLCFLEAFAVTTIVRSSSLIFVTRSYSVFRRQRLLCKRGNV